MQYSLTFDDQMKCSECNNKVHLVDVLVLKNGKTKVKRLCYEHRDN